MATRTVANGGGNWNAIGTWVEGAVPTNADDVVFTVTSGPLVINGPGDCKTFNTTNNSSTITLNSSLRVSGNITLTVGFTITTTSGSPQLIAISTGTLTSNGVTFPYILAFQGVASQTFTLADDWTVTDLIFQNGGFSVIGGNKTIYVNRHLTGGSASNITATGTTIVMQGTGTWNHSASGAIVGADITFNSAGTITLSTMRFSLGTITYVAGSIVATSSTLSLIATATGTTTLNTSGMTWNNINLGGLSTHTWNASSTVYLSGTLTLAGGGGKMQGMWDCSGSITHTGGATYTNAAGTTITMTGTGSISNTAVGSFSCDITINTSGTITFGTNVRFTTGIFSWIAGTVNSTGSNFTASSPCTIDVNGNKDGGGNAICSTGINFFNFTHSGSVSTITLTTPICIINSLILGSGVFNNAGIYCQGSLATSTNSGTGTSTLFLIGSGTINCSAMLRCNTVINTNGIYKFPINFTNNTKIFSFNSAILTYIKGNLDTRNVTFLCQATSTLIGVHKLRFRRVVLSNQITMDDFFQGSASQICQVVSNTAGMAYAVVFTDGFQKISNYTSVQDMILTNTVASRGSLLLTYSKANRGRNVGNITYINNKPNGIIDYKDTVESLETMDGVQLQGDPAYI